MIVVGAWTSLLFLLLLSFVVVAAACRVWSLVPATHFNDLSRVLVTLSCLFGPPVLAWRTPLDPGGCNYSLRVGERTGMRMATASSYGPLLACALSDLCHLVF